MNGKEILDVTIDYLIDQRGSSYSEGLNAEQLRNKAEQELNAMTRCEYLLMFGDTSDMNRFHEKQKLARGETVTKTYIVTLPEDETELDKKAREDIINAE